MGEAAFYRLPAPVQPVLAGRQQAAGKHTLRVEFRLEAPGNRRRCSSHRLEHAAGAVAAHQGGVPARRSGNVTHPLHRRIGAQPVMRPPMHVDTVTRPRNARPNNSIYELGGHADQKHHDSRRSNVNNSSLLIIRINRCSLITRTPNSRAFRALVEPVCPKGTMRNSVFPDTDPATRSPATFARSVQSERGMDISPVNTTLVPGWSL